MSGFYAKVSNVSGSSSVAKSAYMSREEMYDEQQNHTYNYSRHEHDNTFSNVVLCANAPEEWHDKEKLWNAVEKEEYGRNTRKAKQWILAIPQELTQNQAQKAVREFQEFLAKNGMCSQADIHEAESVRSAGEIEKNKHVHVLATQRLINEQGEWEQIKEKKVYANCRDAQGKPDYNPDVPTDAAYRIPKIDPETGEQKIGARNRKEWERVIIQDNPLNRKELIEESRQQWAMICNRYLTPEQQIDHRSYERQGVDKVAQVHEGIGTYWQHDDRVEYNKVVKEVNDRVTTITKEYPEKMKNLKEELDGIKRDIELIGGDRRTAASDGGAARTDPTVERADAEERTRDGIARLEEIKSQDRPFVQNNKEEFERIRDTFIAPGSDISPEKSVGDAAGMHRLGEAGGKIAEGIRKCNEKIGGIGEKQSGIRERLQQLKENFRNVVRQLKEIFSRQPGEEQRSSNSGGIIERVSSGEQIKENKSVPVPAPELVRPVGKMESEEKEDAEMLQVDPSGEHETQRIIRRTIRRGR